MPTSAPAEVDVVVIGAGISGLTAAALLAKAGLAVCVLEREARPGGYIAGFERGPFRFDTAIHWLNQCGPGGFVTTIFDTLGTDVPRAPPLRRIRRYKGESFDYLLTSTPDDLKGQLIRAFPRDSRALIELFRDAKILGERLRDFAHLMRTTATMTPLGRLSRGLTMARWGMPWLKHLRVTAEQGLARRFESPGLRSVFCSEESLVSVLVPIGWAYTGDYQAPPAGGAQSYAAWLCRCLEQAGAPVLFKCAVEQVLLERGAAAGVRLADGRVIKARYLLAAMDVETLYERLLPPGAVPQALLRNLREADIYPSSATLSLGLDVTAQELGLGEELVFLSCDGLARAEHNSGNPDKAGISVLSPTTRDASLAPPGKSTLTIYVSVPITYGERWQTEPSFARGAKYRAFKRAYADKLIERVERTLIPNLRSHIEVAALATPVTHLRYTGNRDGSIMGATASAKNVRSKIAGYHTPVPNLFLAGQWAEYGGGIPMAVKAAANAALLVLQRTSPAAFAELCATLDG